MKGLLATLVLMGTAGVAIGAPNVGNATQKGSLLIFPMIWADEAGNVRRNTLIRIQNDASSGVDVKCYWLDGYKNRVDFIVPVTRNQAIWFEALGGAGTFKVNRFPSGPANGFTVSNKHPFLGPRISSDGFGAYGYGMLACWAVDPGGTHQVKWNHLSGTATLFGADRASEYSATAFFVPVGIDGEPVGVAGTLNLNGVEYDACPLYLVGQFTPASIDAPVPGDFGVQGPPVFLNSLAVTSCSVNLNQDWIPVWTKLGFDVWNEDEIKFTGAYECADSWHETSFTRGGAYRATPGVLGNGPADHVTTDPGRAAVPYALIDGLDAGAQNFDWTTLGTYAARYRVQGLRSTQCERVKPATGNGSDVAGVMTQPVGLLGIQLSVIGAPNQFDVGTALVGVGKMTGRIVWDPAGVAPEGGIR